jgi:hypothetical protein
MAMIATTIEITSTSVATRRGMRVRAIMTTTRIATIGLDKNAVNRPLQPTWQFGAA